MIPCLYDVSETEYKTNGIGKLSDSISCIVTEKRNGSYELKMEYPVDGIHSEELVQGNVILAKPADNKSSQPFRIYKVTSDLSGTMEIDARHISYQLNYITVSPTSVVTGTYDQVNAAFDALKKNATTDCPFTFETDIESDAYFGILEPVSFRSALGGVDGSMLDTFGGEFEWDFYTVRLLKSRGKDNGVRIVYGKNLIDYKQEKNDEDVITGVHPFWRDSQTGDVTELTEKVVTLEETELPYERIGLLDCSTEFEEEPTQAQLRSYARSYLESTSLTDPAIDIDIDFAQLWQTAGYEDIAEAERVSLCDTVHVYISSLGIEVSASVTETEYDVLLERYKSITLSNSPTSSRNSSISLTVATTSQVKSMIAMTDSSIRISVSNIYATKATLENNYSTTVQTQSLIDLAVDGVTLEFNKKLSDDYSTTEEIRSMIELSAGDILLEVNEKLSDYSTTVTMQAAIEEYVDESMAKISLEVTNGVLGSKASITMTAGEYESSADIDLSGVRQAFADDKSAITISAGTITFNSGTLIINSSQFTLDSGGNATFSGNLSAPGGNLGGFTIGTSSIYNGCSSLSSTTNGIYLGTSGIRNYYSGSYLNITTGYVENGDSNSNYSRLYSGTLQFYQTGTYAGAYGTGTWSSVSGTVGMYIHLEYGSDYIAFSRRSSSSGSTYTPAYYISYNSSISSYRHNFSGTANFQDYLYVSSRVYFVNSSGTDHYLNSWYSTYISESGIWTDGAFSTGGSLLVGNTSYSGSRTYALHVTGNAYASGDWYSGSDIVLKTDIKPVDSGIDTVFDELEPITYRYKDDEKAKLHYGISAQDIVNGLESAGIDPDDAAILARSQLEDGTEFWAVAYSELIGVLIYEIKELKNEIKELKG